MNTNPLALSAPDTALSWSVISGYGQEYTLKYDSTLLYPTLMWSEIKSMLSSAESVPKEKARWVIPSTANGYKAREAAYQTDYGRYAFIWQDFDKGNHPLDLIVEKARKALGGYAFVVYASRSSKPDNQKWRLIVPLSDDEINARSYRAFSVALSNLLIELIPDRAANNIVQLCYLPNPGEHYAYHVEDGPILNPAEFIRDSFHPWVIETKTVLNRMATEGRGLSFGTISDRTSISRYAAFRRKHPTASLMVEHLGFETNDGINFHHPKQESKSFSTQLYDDGSLFTLSGTVGSWGGVSNESGTYFSDAFDLYVHLMCRGDRQFAEAYAQQLLEAESAEILEEMHRNLEPLYRKLEAEQEVALAAQKQEDAKAVAEAQEVEKQERKRTRKQSTSKWGGDWLNDVPYEITELTAWEHLAWHAPGMIGEMVRQGSQHSARKTLVPLLAGALASVAYLAQGKAVLVHKQFVSPPSIGIILTGESGSGKGDAPKLFNKIKRLAQGERSRIKSVNLAKFKSGPAVIKFMSEHPEVVLLYEEAGHLAKAGASNDNHMSMIGEMTQIMTGFITGSQASVAADAKYSAEAVNNPCLTAVSISATKTYLETVSSSSISSGWLGRWLNLRLPKHAQMYDDAPEDFRFSKGLKDWVKMWAELEAPSLDVIDPSVWTSGAHRHGYFMMRYSDDGGLENISRIIREFDGIVGDGSRHPLICTFYSRGAEMVARLAFLAAIAKGAGAVDAECVQWAEKLTRLSIDEIGGEYTAQSDEADGDSAAVKSRARHFFERLATDGAAFARMGRKARKLDNGDIEVQESCLKERIKGGKINATILKRELGDLYEDGPLFKRPVTENGVTTQWVRWIG